MTLKYYKNLDGVRAIAALMVMFYHYLIDLNTQSGPLFLLKKISIFGQTGVTLFFVLSGFLITRILLYSKKKEGYFKNFYVRRILRIFPLYYLFLILWYFVLPFVFNTPIVGLKDQLYYYTYLQNFAMTFNWSALSSGPVHFWSLGVEEHFYLFWPLVVYYASNKNLLRIIIAIIIFAFGLRFYMLHLNYEVFFFTFTRFDSLAIGALLSLMELKNIFKKENAVKFLLLGGTILIPTIALWTLFTGASNYTIQVTKYVLLSFTYFALIGYVLSIKENNVINHLLESRFFAYTGKISYGLYVFHPVAFELTTKFLDSGNWLINMTTGFVISYVISAVSFYLFESQFLKLKKYFEYNSDKKKQVSNT